MKDKILAAFQALGFELEPADDYGYMFRYEGIAMFWFLNQDEYFLNICIPNIFEQESEDDLLFYRVMDKINNTMKYVKANSANGYIWLSYERQIIGDENIEAVLPQMILALEESYHLVFTEQDDDDDEQPTDQNINNLTTESYDET